MKTQSLVIFIASLLLFACAKAPTPQPSTMIHRDAYVALAEAASTTSQSITHLGAIAQAANPPRSVTEPPDPASYGMAIPVSIDWNGPVQPIVQQIAATTNYKLRVLGQAPAIPIIISMSAKNAVIGNVLRDIGYQCGQRAQVVVFPSTRTIELRYART